MDGISLVWFDVGSAFVFIHHSPNSNISAIGIMLSLTIRRDRSRAALNLGRNRCGLDSIACRVGGDEVEASIHTGLPPQGILITANWRSHGRRATKDHTHYSA